MNKLKIFYFSIFLFLCITVYVLYSNILFKLDIYDNLKTKISYQTKEKLLKNIFIFKYIQNLEDTIKTKDEIIKRKRKIIFDLSNEKVFNFTKENEFNKSNLKIRYFQNIDFTEMGPRAYFSKNKENLFVITGTGKLYYTNIDELNPSKEIKFKKIKTNFSELIGEENILDDMIITKGLEIIENKVYTSVVFKKNDCYTNTILEAELNYKKLAHKIFFEADMCIPHFTYGTGGSIVKYKDNKILMTIGDWEYVVEKDFFDNTELNPQTNNNLVGKFISISLDDPKDINIIAKGTRNAQGLFYDVKHDVIFSSEHGPQGGDEVNIIKNSKEIVNLGWPISSYGDHYGYPDFGEIPKNKEKYKRAPLKKSHNEYGFLEPLIYFPKESPGASQVLKNNEFENYSDKYHIIYFGTLGDSNYGSKTLFKYVLDEKFNLTKQEEFYIDDRIRDMIYVKKLNIMVLFLEGSGSIAIIENQNKKVS